MQLNFKIPDVVIRALDSFIDGIQYRNRAQLITVILAEWIKQHWKLPGDPLAPSNPFEQNVSEIPKIAKKSKKTLRKPPKIKK